MAEGMPNEIQRVENEITIQRLKRRARLEMIEEYFNFIGSRVLGLGLFTVGVLEILSPDTIPAVIPQPGGLVGVGAALLVGKKAAELIARLKNG